MGLGAVALAPGAALFNSASKAFGDKTRTDGITTGDAALLRFPAAAEILETDFWVQYNELAGIQDSEVPGGSGNPAYTEALKVLDEDMDQYTSMTIPRMSSLTTQFLNAYLVSKGAQPVQSQSVPHLAGQHRDRSPAESDG